MLTDISNIKDVRGRIQSAAVYCDAKIESSASSLSSFSALSVRGDGSIRHIIEGVGEEDNGNVPFSSKN